MLLGAGSENSVVEDNQIHGNLGEQVFVHNAHGHRIEGNTMHGIPSDPNLDSDGGVLLEGASDNVLVDNTVHDTGDAGVMIAERARTATASRAAPSTATATPA